MQINKTSITPRLHTAAPRFHSSSGVKQVMGADGDGFAIIAMETKGAVIGWASPYEKSRVVFLQPGHGRETHELPWYRRLVRQAVLWAAGR